MTKSRAEKFEDWLRGQLIPEEAFRPQAQEAEEPDDRLLDGEGDLPPPVTRDPSLKSPLDMMHEGQRRHQESQAAAALQPGSHIFMDPNAPFDFDQNKGSDAPLGVNFVPFGAVARYCYKFVPPHWLQHLASAFFDANKIYSRRWAFYFTPPSDCGPALAFITQDQLQTLIDEINIHFPSANITIHEDVSLDFDDVPPHLRPRWAGYCSSRSQYNSLLYKISVEPPMVLPDSSDRSLEAFKSKMEAAAEANKAKSKKAKTAKKQEFMVKRQGMVKEMLRAQRYLGLLAKNSDSSLPDISNLSLTSVDATQPPPHAFDEEPIFIAIDAEALERSQRTVTEVGVATLDTRDLCGHAPGEAGKDWHQHIRARHFRVIEYKDHVNHEFIQGCPANFEFGKSELISQAGLASALASCFRHPFSKTSASDERVRDDQHAPEADLETRQIVLVGHDLGQDVNYCHDIGFSILNRGNILDSIDTVDLYRTFSKDPNARSLGSVLYDFEFPAWHLHNAGNDAVYTMHAMLAICVKQASERGSEAAAKRVQEDLERRTQLQTDGAKERAKDDYEGWDSNSGDDGVVALRPPEHDFKPKGRGSEKPQFGPPPPPQPGVRYTIGGAILDV